MGKKIEQAEYTIVEGFSGDIREDNEWTVWSDKRGAMTDISTEEAERLMGGKVGRDWQPGDPIRWP